jgi:hypothetical protein
MELAGELDDRWFGSRKRTGREESPDTESAQAEWASRLVTPGEPLYRPPSEAGVPTVHGQCHREQTACEAQPGDSPEENLRDIFEWPASPVRVKRWGKSPPPRWQHRGQGKPREVQDQIGGQSWPGSLSAFCANERRSFPRGASCVD